MRRSFLVLAVATVALAACGSDDTASNATTPATSATIDSTTPDSTTPDSTTSDSTTPDGTTPDGTTPGDTGTDATDTVDTGVPDRPYEVFVPSTYSPDTPAPLVLLLHGFGATGDTQESYLQLQPLAESRGFLYVHPDGTLNQIGRQFWNATPACCGLNSTVDDVGYLLAIIDQVSADYNVDPRRVYFIGHSNGGFMSYRMACDAADRVAAIASLAGATFLDPNDCDPSEPVSVLQVHGTADATIAYDGGITPILGSEYPGARQTVSTWAQYDGCGPTATPAENGLDIDQSIAGDETAAETFDDCPAGIDVELWTIDGGQHIPTIATPTQPYPLSEGMIDFLLSHPKP